MGEQRSELKKVGSLWLKEGKTKYLSGVIELFGVETTILIFPNDKGDNEKRPDYRIFTPDDGEREELDKAADAFF